MKVILLKDIRGVGRKGDIKELKDGYVRNLLLPQKLVAIATSQKIAASEQEKLRREADHAAHVAHLKKIAEDIKSLTLLFSVKSGEKGEVFGSVSAQDIEAVLKEKGFSVSIQGKHHIKTLGEHEIDIDLGDGVQTKTRIRVEPEG